MLVEGKGGDLGPEHRQVASHRLHAPQAAPEAGESVSPVAVLRISRRGRDDADGEGNVFHVDGAEQEGNHAHHPPVHLDDPDVGLVAGLVHERVVGQHGLVHALAHSVVDQADDLGKLSVRALLDSWHVVILYLWDMGQGPGRGLGGATFLSPAGGATFLSPTGTGGFLAACSSVLLCDLVAGKCRGGRSVEWGLRPPCPPLVGDKKVAGPGAPVQTWTSLVSFGISFWTAPRTSSAPSAYPCPGSSRTGSPKVTETGPLLGHRLPAGNTWNSPPT